MSTTLEHRRADAAFRLAASFNDKKPHASFETIAPGFGAEVQRCGLLQAVAFLRRRADKDVAERLAAAIRNHLISIRMVQFEGDPPDLLEVVRGLEADDYMAVTREVLALSVWIRRSAQ